MRAMLKAVTESDANTAFGPGSPSGNGRAPGRTTAFAPGGWNKSELEGKAKGKAKRFKWKVEKC